MNSKHFHTYVCTQALELFLCNNHSFLTICICVVHLCQVVLFDIEAADIKVVALELLVAIGLIKVKTLISVVEQVVQEHDIFCGSGGIQKVIYLGRNESITNECSQTVVNCSDMDGQRQLPPR